jgi:Mce-associated membrane protein
VSGGRYIRTRKGGQSAERSPQAPNDRPAAGSTASSRKSRWTRWLGYGVLPAVALLLALGAGYVKWQDGTARDAEVARSESTQAAIDSTIAMLSYRADTADHDLSAACERLTGRFREAYSSLINDVVIPGAKQKNISAVATVPAASSVFATTNHAVVLVFVNQTTLVGNEPPTTTTSTVRVTLSKVGPRWLVSGFTPI